MKQYLDLCRHIISTGKMKTDRTGTGTISTFGNQIRFDLAEGFPLVTTKKLSLRAIIHELLWFISGETNIKYLKENNVKIWDNWANPDGELGPVYGHQWRHWTKALSGSANEGASERANERTTERASAICSENISVSASDSKNSGEIDQLSDVISQIKSNPDSRRLIVSAWNPSDIPNMALPPCHCFFQFYVVEGKLSCMLYQRSCDVFLGVPFNIASYSLLTMMVAQVCGLEVGEFIHTFGDTHIYLNHLEQVDLQLTREPRKLPIMKLNQNIKSIFDFRFEDFTLEGYDPHPHIRGDISV